MRVFIASALIAALAVAAPTPPSTFAHEFEGLKPILALQNGEDSVKSYEIAEKIFSINMEGSIMDMIRVQSEVREIAQTMKNAEASLEAYEKYFKDIKSRFASMNPEAIRFLRKHGQSTAKAVIKVLSKEMESAIADFEDVSADAKTSMKKAFPATYGFFEKTVSEENFDLMKAQIDI